MILILSMAYALYKNLTFQLSYQKPMVVELKLLSGPKVNRGTVSFTAKLVGCYVGIYDHGKNIRILSGDKVVLRLPFTKTLLRRGYIIKTKGMFFNINELKSISYMNYLKSNEIKAIFEGYSDNISVIKKPKYFTIIPILNSLGSYIAKINCRLLIYPQSEFASAILTGNRDTIPFNIKEIFIRSGTMHILAVSGLHVGFLVMLFILFFRSLHLKQNITYIVTMLFIILYSIFIGDTPSVKRASIMAICGILVLLFDRDRDYINALAIAFILIWIINPTILFSPGFLLSFSATFGILFLTPKFYRLFKRFLPKYIASSLAATFSVQVYILPVMLYFFKSFAYINVLANLPIVPLAGLSIALEIMYLILYPIFLPLAVIISEVNIVTITVIMRIAGFFSNVPMLEVNSFSPYLIPLYFIFITVTIYFIFEKFETDKENAEDYGLAIDSSI